MPKVAMRGERIRKSASRLLATTSLTLGLFTLVGIASAASGTNGGIEPVEVISYAAVIGALGFAAVTAALHARARALHRIRIETLSKEIGDLRLAAERAETLLSADDQRMITWVPAADGADRPEDEEIHVVGTLPDGSGAPRNRTAFLCFEKWLIGGDVLALDRHITALRQRGEPFQLVVTSLAGSSVEATGRLAGGRVVVRFRDLSREQIAHVELAEQYQAASRKLDIFQTLLEALPMPVWARDGDGHLIFANPAYGRAVEAATPAQAVLVGAELLDSPTREAIQRSRAGTPVFARRLPMVAAGNRRMFDIIDTAAASGSAGIACDVTDLEQAQAELRRTIDNHSRTLDQLATAVAIFGPDRRLQFYNHAYQTLFGLETRFLDSQPEDSAILDQLRHSRKLPEQADYRAWRKDMLASYQAVEAKSFWWHLPGGETLRIIANPNPKGGVTYIYENFTEQLSLERRYDALARVQGETLDHLSEGVVVFGSDGRLRLYNTAFARMWHQSAEDLDRKPHVNDVVAACRQVYETPKVWEEIRIAVTGLAETRQALDGRIERDDGLVFDYATVPLPDGATMITFVNVTASVQVERVLTERNDALEQADQLKNAFIQHVSYELRSPLTNIIGFTQLLADAKTGELNLRQKEYTGYILSSSDALLAIVNDILDLATVDAGMMQLDYAEVSVREVVEAVVHALSDRLHEAHQRLRLHIGNDVDKVVVDPRRLRQILFNLLSNAVTFSPDGAEIALTATIENDDIVFIVADRGSGIARDFLPNVFDRFESRSQGARRRGAGLGLPVVRSFVKLHGGSVDIASEAGHGTTVTVRLPRLPVRTIPHGGTVAAE